MCFQHMDICLYRRVMSPPWGFGLLVGDTQGCVALLLTLGFISVAPLVLQARYGLRFQHMDICLYRRIPTGRPLDSALG